MDLVMHSYSLRDYPLEHVFAVAAHYGFDSIEVSTWHLDLRGNPDVVPGEVARAVALGDRYGVRVHCVGYEGDFTVDDPDRHARSVTLVGRIVEACGGHGIELVNGCGGWLQGDPDDWRNNGSVRADDGHYARTGDAYRTLGAIGAREGVRVAVEVHPNTVHDTVTTTARLLDLVDHPAVIATVDPANSALLTPEDRNPAVLDRLGNRVGYFHIKNYVPAGGRADFSVDTAHGVIDNLRWLEKLAEHGGVPAMALEYCGVGDPHPRLQAALRYVRECEALLDVVAARR
ncbi:sugar phosphate isomerase/epimerase [Plantactinospora sp. S1510]|uniref:Sugar phosphate isomerase/epimerase n=1 Tax=Plantactinospora alkalitolerans TaxID=2789879 RepID=A0ABS0GTY0_9ACTN|nr:sugar phosphate isomerase/epimerase family protein [Plantactinospora alkalitolerans]MBF9129664.1 sugar phosphate isomerase/epimerase [Plantactinospora alkalitolerans]